jgi:hypothetical protein
MRPAAEFQFEGAVKEYSDWRAVAEAERSPAPAWWWQPAFEVRHEEEEMMLLSCFALIFRSGRPMSPETPFRRGRMGFRG